MALQPTQVTARSNSDLIAIGMIADNAALDPAARMVAILDYVRMWDAATSGSTGRQTAERNAHAARERGTLYGTPHRPCDA